MNYAVTEQEYLRHDLIFDIRGFNERHTLYLKHSVWLPCRYCHRSVTKSQK